MNTGRKQTLGLFLLGGLLRLLAAGQRPLWYDEAFSILIAKKGINAILYGFLAPDAGGNAADVHPPAYFSLLAGWVKVFGSSVWAGRGLSILFGVLTLWLAYRLACLLLEEHSARAGLLLLAISPFHIHYSQEARMYAMLAFFLVAAALALQKALLTRKARWWAAYALLAALAQYTHNLAVITLIPLTLTPLLHKDRRAFRNAVLASLAAVVLYLPWLTQIPGQLGKIQTAYWTSRPGIARLFSTMLIFVSNLPLPGILLPIGLFLTMFVLAIALWLTIRMDKTKTPGFSPGLWLAYMAFVPPLLLFLISQVQPVYIERALLPSGVFFALWLGWVIAESRSYPLYRNTLLVFLAAAAAIGIYQNITYRQFPYGSYQEVDGYLHSQISIDAVIIHSNKLTALPMIFYAPNLPQEYIADPPGSGSDTLALPTQEALGLLASPSIEAAAGEADQVWLIIFSKAIEEYQDLGESTHPHLAWLNENYHLTITQTWDDLLVYHYEK